MSQADTAYRGYLLNAVFRDDGRGWQLNVYRLHLGAQPAPLPDGVVFNSLDEAHAIGRRIVDRWLAK